MAGLDSTGFSIARIEDIQASINTVLTQIFGPQINLIAPSIVSQLRDTFAERESLLWEAMAAVYASQSPDSATGVQLDNLVAINGIQRLGATSSTQQALRLFGTVGTTIPSGTQISVLGAPSSIFQTTSAVVLIAGTNEVELIQFSGIPVSGTWALQFYDQITTNLAFNATASQIQTALQALSKFGNTGTVTGNYTLGFTVSFAGVAGLQPQPLLITSQPTALQTSVPSAVVITVSETTAGVAQGSVNAQALSTGPKTAPAFTLTTIVTPVTGLSSTLNVTDASIGRNVETDAQLRLRRSQTLGQAGAATVEAIRSKLLNITGVTAALVFENPTEAIDAFNRPPKSFEAVVLGGAAQTIVDEIFLTKPAGIRSYGNASGVHVDSMGFTHTIGYSRPYVVDLYAIVNINTDHTGEVPSFPAGGVSLVQLALSNFVAGLGIGRDVIVNPGLMSALEPIVGIYNAQILIGIAPTPTTSTPVPVTAEQAGRLLTSNILVNILS